MKIDFKTCPESFLMTLIQTAIRVLESYEEKVLFAYLFGSLARDEATLASDFDIAVYCAGNKPESYFDMKLALYSD